MQVVEYTTHTPKIHSMFLMLLLLVNINFKGSPKWDFFSVHELGVIYSPFNNLSLRGRLSQMRSATESMAN